MVILSLSPGARAQSGSILVKLQEVKAAQDELNQKQAHLQQLEQELNGIRRTAEK